MGSRILGWDPKRVPLELKIGHGQSHCNLLRENHVMYYHRRHHHHHHHLSL
jgi:hypothetical protein